MAVHIEIYRGLGNEPQLIYCHACNVTTVTRVEFTPTARTHLYALLLCLFGCWFCCCCPYCVDGCQQANHYCPTCGSFVGTSCI